MTENWGPTPRDAAQVREIERVLFAPRCEVPEHGLIARVAVLTVICAPILALVYLVAWWVS